MSTPRVKSVVVMRYWLAAAMRLIAAVLIVRLVWIGLEMLLLLTDSLRQPQNISWSFYVRTYATSLLVLSVLVVVLGRYAPHLARLILPMPRAGCPECGYPTTKDRCPECWTKLTDDEKPGDDGVGEQAAQDDSAGRSPRRP